LNLIRKIWGSKSTCLRMDSDGDKWGVEDAKRFGIRWNLYKLYNNIVK